MKKLLLLPCLFLFFPLSTLAQDDAATEPIREFVMEDGDTMKQYIMVFLYRGERANDYSEAELQEIQAGHMANINRLAEQNIIISAGPMGDDGELRGIFIMDLATVEEALHLTDTDPAIQAGRLRAEAHPWWAAKGTVLR